MIGIEDRGTAARVLLRRRRAVPPRAPGKASKMAVPIWHMLIKKEWPDTASAECISTPEKRLTEICASLAWSTVPLTQYSFSSHTGAARWKRLLGAPVILEGHMRSDELSRHAWNKSFAALARADAADRDREDPVAYRVAARRWVFAVVWASVLISGVLYWSL